MVRSYPGALFLAAGGYHHHLGLNTWQSQGAPPPPEGALGLDRYELVLPDAADVDAAADRLARAATRCGWTRAWWPRTRRELVLLRAARLGAGARVRRTTALKGGQWDSGCPG